VLTEIGLAQSSASALGKSIPDGQAVANSINGISKELEDVRSGMPNGKQVAQLGASLDSARKQLEAIQQLLPTLEQVRALRDQLEAQRSLLARPPRPAQAVSEPQPQKLPGSARDAGIAAVAVGGPRSKSAVTSDVEPDQE
jgi:hypothetical protein